MPSCCCCCWSSLVKVVLVGRRGLIRLEMISGDFPRNEFVSKELDKRLSDGVPRKLRLGECTLLYMSIDCLLVQEENLITLLQLHAYEEKDVKLKNLSKCIN